MNQVDRPLNVGVIRWQTWAHESLGRYSHVYDRAGHASAGRSEYRQKNKPALMAGGITFLAVGYSIDSQ